MSEDLSQPDHMIHGPTRAVGNASDICTIKRDSILHRLRFSGVGDYEIDPGVCEAAAKEIERLQRELSKEQDDRDIARRDADLYCATLARSATHLGCEPHMVDHAVARLVEQRNSLLAQVKRMATASVSEKKPP